MKVTLKLATTITSSFVETAQVGKLLKEIEMIQQSRIKSVIATKSLKESIYSFILPTLTYVVFIQLALATKIDMIFTSLKDINRKLYLKVN